MPFELNCGYYFCVFFKENINPYSWLKIVNKLLAELQELMTVYRKNFYHDQEFQKRAHDKGIMPKSYAPSDKL